MEDPFQEDEREAQRKAQEEIARQRYEKIMATKDGRWVMWEILRLNGTFYPATHPHETGMQAAGMALRDTIRAVNVDLYHQMIVENDR